MKTQNINFVNGDATKPIGNGPRIIAHVCNDIGGWGRGFVGAISKRWEAPEKEYRQWFKEKESFGLGKIQLVECEPELWVANMVGQKGIRYSANGEPPVRYPAIEDCLATLASKALELEASVHMPRIGCGLAGGEWPIVEALIEKTLLAKGVEVVVYDFE